MFHAIGMRILFLDPAGFIGSIACVTESETPVLDVMDRRITDKDIIPLIDTILAKAGWTYADLTHLASVTGPGGFTSLRTGIALLNVFSDQLQIPVAGVHESDVYAARVTDADWVWCHSTRIDQFFVRGFGAYASLFPEPALIDVDVFANQIPEGILWTGELIEGQQKKLSPKNMKPLDLKPLGDVLPEVVKGLPFAMTPLLPWYGRSL